jgi:RNA polymerase sigma-70 factor, ECF subfamily
MSQALEGADFMQDEEKKLISRAQSGDVESFEALIRDYQIKLYRLIVSVTGNAEDAEDALQETLLLAYRALPRFRGDSLFSTWLYKIALNTTRNWLRSHIRGSSERIASKMVRVGLDQGPSVDEELLDHERCELIRKAIMKLPDHYRDAILLRHYRDMQYEEIAEVLDIPLGTVRSRIAKGRCLLMKELNALGLYY